MKLWNLITKYSSSVYEKLRIEWSSSHPDKFSNLLAALPNNVLHFPVVNNSIEEYCIK